MLVFLEFRMFSNLPKRLRTREQKQPHFSAGRLLRIYGNSSVREEMSYASELMGNLVNTGQELLFPSELYLASL